MGVPAHDRAGGRRAAAAAAGTPTLRTRCPAGRRMLICYAAGSPKETMDANQLKDVFDRQAAGYDKQWENLAPIRDALHFLLRSVFAGLPTEARVLCVGVGTGQELSDLAAQFPRWRFTAVDLSGAMLDLCRSKADRGGFLARCVFHEGTIDSLPDGADHDGATCFLVSQFIRDRSARAAFFRAIGRRLKRGGTLASTDLSAEPAHYEALLRAWMTMMSTGAGMPPDGLDRMREAYRKDVAILPAAMVESIIESAGFTGPVQFYQAGIIRGWFAERL